ncbi:MAG: hydroxymethylglutaryl-CoA lyase [Pseudomonadales bacterium]|jgi:hydroxymethylglutaryl-CoA lyase|nr:hydroxymethylglutaryl-CoA lyase [Pseudomonadales bacterium]MDP6470582.1 hydroxymethylglutaryl-CoA lyase [Pseudomonadales bacterium]MDP6828563.1 hydroxymethylglutaryl-CoA lyase [Pseudomonadales bacterium]MDP6971871.1 hydroxymethylglutaryl-CoA lyase [Pseudomonadales bacterium]
MRDAVMVMEVSPRDGLQNEAVLVSTEDKLKLIDRALDAGCRRIEVTSFVHPGRVPQMADAEAIVAGLPQRGDVTYTALVLNERGYQRLLATGRLDEVGLVVPASDTFCRENQGMEVDDAVTMARAILRDACNRGLRAQVTIAVAFGCPFEGEVPFERVVEIADALAQERPVEIALADTVGVGVPGQVADLFAMLRQRLGENMPLRAHFHDTRNMGIANAFAALQAGVSTLDASIGGIGGCPFAPNATGNIATEDLVYMLERMRIQHEVNLDCLIDTSDWLQSVLGKAVPSALLKAGGFPQGNSA